MDDGVQEAGLQDIFIRKIWYGEYALHSFLTPFKFRRINNLFYKDTEVEAIHEELDTLPLERTC
jgi:hypothetical protein